MPAKGHQRRRRSVLTLPKAQTGDWKIDALAGRDIRQGADANVLLAMWYEWLVDERQYKNLDTQEREDRRVALDDELRTMKQEIAQLRIGTIIVALLIVVLIIVQTAM